MNSRFFALVSIFLSAALSGLLSSVEKPQDKNITNFLFVAVGLTSASWGGYIAGTHVERNKKDKPKPPVPTTELPRFSIQYPSKIVSSPKDVVGGAFVRFTQEHEHNVWLCVSDGETYTPYPIINADTVDKGWTVANVAFKKAKDESNDLSYGLEVIIATNEANADLRVVHQQKRTLRRLPSGTERISDKVVVVPRSVSQLLSPIVVDNVQQPQQSFEPSVIENPVDGGWLQGRITRYVDDQTAGYITGDDGTSYYFMTSRCLFKKIQVNSGDRVIFQVATPLKANGNPRAVRVFGVLSEIALDLSDPLAPGRFCFVKLFSDVDPGDMHSIFVINLSGSTQQGRVVCTIDINERSRSGGPVAKILN